MNNFVKFVQNKKLIKKNQSQSIKKTNPLLRHANNKIIFFCVQHQQQQQPWRTWFYKLNLLYKRELCVLKWFSLFVSEYVFLWWHFYLLYDDKLKKTFLCMCCRISGSYCRRNKRKTTKQNVNLIQLEQRFSTDGSQKIFNGLGT